MCRRSRDGSWWPKDEALIRLDLVEMLREEGYDVVGEAGDGQAAVDLAVELKPDLVIMDV